MSEKNIYTKLGIIGGMGSLATYCLYKLIIDGTNAPLDQDHINMVILNHAQIPDRTKAILYGGESPLPYIKADCEICVNAGCDVITIPCNTSHFFFDEIQKSCKAKVLNMIELTAQSLSKEKADSVFLFATEGTIKTGVYKKEFDKKNISIITPSESEIALMMKMIYGIKANADISEDIKKFKDIFQKHTDNGCKKFVLGCTELSAVYSEILSSGISESTLTDALRILRDEILLIFGKRTKT